MLSEMFCLIVVLLTFFFTEDSTAEALLTLKPNKVDASGISSEHLKFASPVYPSRLLFYLLLSFAMASYMPQCLRDSVIVPIPKGNKDASCSSNYRPVALSSNLSKVLERLILSKYENCFSSSPLQFGLNQASLPLCVPVQ